MALARLRHFLSLSARMDGVDLNQLSHVVFSHGSCTPNEIELPASGNEARLELYGTGLRNVTEIRAISAVIGGVPVPVLYAGAQQQYPGMDQVVVSVPPELKGRGEVDILLLVDGQPANSVRVTFR